MSGVPKALAPAQTWRDRVSMRNAWTGGQYSLYRAALGIALAACFHAGLHPGDGGPAWLSAGGLLLSLGLAVGAADRIAAAALLVAWLLEPGGASPGADWDRLLVPGLLLAHAAIPGSPYGAFRARGRVDPGGGWRLPAAIYAAAWIAQLAAGIAAVGPLLALAAPLALLDRTRPLLWLALLGLHAGRALLGAADPSLGLWLLQALSFDPGWVRPKAEGEVARLFYDGGCGLCHRAVRFVLAEDREGRAFRFAPLAGEAFARLLPAAERAALPDSLVLWLPDGRVLVRSRSVREIGARLGGIWRLLAGASGALPARGLDALYDVVARYRARLFAKPADACPLLPPALRERFE